VNGEIVDYAGVFTDETITDALEYVPEIRNQVARNIEDLLDDFEDQLAETMGIFEDIEEIKSEEGMDRAIAVANEHRAEFEDNYARLQDMYESIAPDKRLETRGLRDSYKWLTEIDVNYRNSRRDHVPERDIKKKDARYDGG
jgi:type I restriction enzyme R subunit